MRWNYEGKKEREREPSEPVPAHARRVQTYYKYAPHTVMETSSEIWTPETGDPTLATKMTTLVTRRDLFSAGFEHRPLPEDSLSAQL